MDDDELIYDPFEAFIVPDQWYTFEDLKYTINKYIELHATLQEFHEEAKSSLLTLLFSFMSESLDGKKLFFQEQVSDNTVDYWILDLLKQLNSMAGDAGDEEVLQLLQLFPEI